MTPSRIIKVVEPTNDLVTIAEYARDLATIIDTNEHRLRGAREIDLGEDVVIQEKAMKRAHEIGEHSNNLAAVIDSNGIRIIDPREIDIDLSEHTLIPDKSMGCAPGINERAHDLAAIIGVEDDSSQRHWKIDLGKGQFIVAAPELSFGGAGFLWVKGRRCIVGRRA
jgi:hypothetical protein